MHKDIKNEHYKQSRKKAKNKTRKDSEERYRLNLTNTGGKKRVSCGQLGCVLD